jgi:outer membrane receptor protein involved in Fe transport
MRSRSFAFLISAGLLFLSGNCLPAFAQDTDIETVVVTGSRIPKPESDTANPVVSLGSSEIQHSGTINLTDYLKRIPALAGSLGDYETSGYATPASDDGSSLGGLNLLDLRNLGYVRTLVLVDGHRMVSEATGSTAVDISTIPITLIDRVEVVTGGASAVYGADGVSGVVNFVMKHDLEGVHARVQGGTSEDGGGGKYLASVAIGHNFDNDKGNVTFDFEGSREQSLYFTKRDFTDVGGFSAFVPNPANLDGSDPTLPANIPTRNAQFVYSAPTGALETDGLVNPACGYNFCNGVPDHLGNGQPFNLGTSVGGGSAIGSSGMPYAQDLQGDFQPSEYRGLAQAETTYQFSPMLKIDAEFKYAYVTTKSFSTAPYDDDILINSDNAFLPSSLATLIAANGGQAILSEDYLEMRNAEQVNRHTYNGVLDASGALPSPGFIENLKYDVSYVYGQSDIDDITLRNRNIDRFAAALDSVIDPATGKPTCRSNLDPSAAPPDLSNIFGIPAFSDTSADFDSADFGLTFTPGPNSGCVPFNPFNPTYNNKASIAFMTQNTDVKGFLSQEVFNGYVSADVKSFKDWGFAGPLSVVFGGEWRKEESKSTPDPITEVPGLFWFGGTEPVSGQFNVGEAFAEVSLPVVAEKRFVEELTFDGAVRASHYSTSGDDTSWKLDGIYSPFAGIKFRGTDAVAVRAPNIGELFAPNQGLYSFIDDPCDVDFIGQGTKYRAANCQAIENGVVGPGNYTAGTTSVQTDSTTPTDVSGNAALRPETARTLTGGVVIQPDFLPGFTATVDWYRVRIADAIEAPSGQDVANECVDLSTINNPYCADITRTATGNFPGSISLVSTGQINVAEFETSGIDLTMDYQADTQDWFGTDYGTVNFHLIGNHLDSLSTVPLPGEAAIKGQNTVYGGVDGGPTPYWSANLDVVWTYQKLTVDYNVDWTNGVLITDRQTVASEPNFVAGKYLHLPDRDIHSLQVGYDFAQGLNAYFGVDNLFYQKPALGENAYPASPLGRFYYLGLKADLDFGDF